MLLVVDAFAEMVEEARRRLSAAEGHNVTVGELAKRAGISRSTLYYNLSEKRSAEGRRIDAAIVQKLAPVLGLPESELRRAAAVAAGYQVPEEDIPDVGTMVVRYLSQDITPEERRRTLLRLQDILHEEMRRELEARNGNDDA